MSKIVESAIAIKFIIFEIAVIPNFSLGIYDAITVHLPFIIELSLVNITIWENNFFYIIFRDIIYRLLILSLCTNVRS